MPASERHIFVVGPNRLQDELLATYIAEQLGLPCTVSGTVDEAREASETIVASRTLLLRECPSPSARGVRQQLLAGSASLPGAVLALFNVPPGEDVERDVIPLGVRGFFYRTEGPKILLRGIPALFAGELWMSRKAMTECLISGRIERNGGTEEDLCLTRREMEVLASVAAGATNDVIANRLCISPHTVKTHVYRIFRKVGVSNRLEAALWAAKNI